MIPKKIHYCWFGGNPLPEKDRKCIETWKKFCPDYEIIRWDETNYDITKNRYMKEAYDAKKWGFVPDFARLDIIYENGGIYLDTDVELVRNMDDLLGNESFMGFEDGIHVSPGLCIAAIPHHPSILKLMNIYEKRHFINDDGTLDMTTSPQMNTSALKNMGLKQDNTLQRVEGITIYPNDYFCPRSFDTGELNMTENTYAIHWFNASWAEPEDKFLNKMRWKYSKYGRLGTIFYSSVRKILKLKVSMSKRGLIGTVKYYNKKLMEKTTML